MTAPTREQLEQMADAVESDIEHISSCQHCDQLRAAAALLRASRRIWYRHDRARAMSDKYGFTPTVICRDHGKQTLTDEQYEAGLNRPNDFWRCPVCHDDADWDDSCLPE